MKSRSGQHLDEIHEHVHRAERTHQDFSSIEVANEVLCVAAAKTLDMDWI